MSSLDNGARCTPSSFLSEFVRLKPWAGLDRPPSPVLTRLKPTDGGPLFAAPARPVILLRSLVSGLIGDGGLLGVAAGFFAGASVRDRCEP
jgi:hypothetical protein